MKKYTWEEIKNESGIYKTFCEHKYPALNSHFGAFIFDSNGGEIIVLNPAGGKEINSDSCWSRDIFVKISN